MTGHTGKPYMVCSHWQQGSEVRRLFVFDGERHTSLHKVGLPGNRVGADELALPSLFYLLLVALGQDVGVRAKC